MKKELSPGAAIAIIVVVAALILFFGWRMINREPTPQSSAAAPGDAATMPAAIPGQGAAGSGPQPGGGQMVAPTE